MAWSLSLSALLAAALVGRAASSPQAGGTLSATDLAPRLLALTSPADRQALLAAHPALVDAALLRALIGEARRLIDATEYGAARAAYEFTVALAEQLGDRINLASALIGLGSIHGRQGDYPAASETLRAGLAVAESIADVERIDAALHNLGIVHRLQGDHEEALRYYERVIALAERTDRAHLLGPTYNNIGIVHTLRGHYRSALEALHRSLQLKEAANDRAGLPSTLTNLGNVHVQQGHPELALEYYRRSLAVAEEVGQLARRSVTLNDIGHAYAALGQHERALAFFERALPLHEAAGQQAEAATALFNIGRSQAARGVTAAAGDYHQRSLAIRESINDRPGVAESLVALGHLALAGGDAAAALDLANRAAQLAGASGHRESFWQSRVLAGRSHEVRGALAAAHDDYLAAVETVEGLRADVAGAERDRQRYFERKLEPYHRLVGLLLARGRAADALAMAERARARVLIEVLRDGPSERRLLTADERAHEQALERRLSDLRSRLWVAEASTPPDPTAIARLQVELGTARLQHAEHRAALYAAHDTLRLQRGDTPAGSVADAAALLADERSAILEFLVADEATYLFVLARDGDRQAGPDVQTATFRLDLPRERLVTMVDRFRRQLERRDLDFQQTARDLYDAVLGPAEALLRDRTHLVIVPDGALWELPFQALRPRRTGYLIEHAAVSFAPSIGVLRELRARRARRAAPRAPTLLAFADPIPPAPGAGRSSPAAIAFEPLPDAARQVRALAALYGRERSAVFEGHAASERALRDVAGETSVLHLATHGLLDNAAPMYSYLLLSGDPSAAAAGDGRLEAWEIVDLRLPVEAVIVAACETALGRIGPGEGMIGLSWAFFLAGSPRTVASLWKVDAASTTDLMLAFHRRFRDGLARNAPRPGAAASLRDGALALLRSERYRHPFYWAAFVVIGDGG